MDSSNFTPPARRSMTDAQIQEALGNAQADEAGITAAMELLETQAQLRDIEKMEFSSWVIEMERIGTPEALLAVENANRAQQGLPPLEAPTAAAPSVEPIEDVVSRLNDLYAAQAPTVIEPEIAPFFANEEAAPVVEESVNEEPQVVVEEIEVVVEAADSDFDEFERLLAADTVVGAEDDVTALEEELVTNLTPIPSNFSEEVFEVVEPEPGVVFADDSQIENVGIESTPKLHRRSRSVSQFWAWLAITGSVLPLGLAWFVNNVGISFSQAILAIFLGATASAIVVSVGALAGKRSGLPTLMISRAAFGVYANAAPASILTLARIFWSFAIIAVAVSFGTEFLAVDDVTNFSSSNVLTLGGVLVLITAGAVTLAVFGGRVLFRAQQVAGLVGVSSFVALAVATAGSINLEKVLAVPTSGWLSTFGIAVLTFAIFGLAWTSAGADYARKLAINARGAAVVGWGALAIVVVPTLIAGFGLAILGSVGNDATGALTSPGFYSETMLQKFAAIFAPWLSYVLVGSLGVTIIVVLAMAFYSTNLSLHSLGARLKPALAQPILGALAIAAGIASALYVADVWDLVSGYALIFAVPVAAWSGIFVSDILIRRIAYHEISLSRSYGFYKSVNWVNIAGWVVATTLGFGLTYSGQLGFGWTGFLADLMVNQDFWSTTSFGIVIAFAFGSLMPVVAGIPRIKRQEAEVLAIESRRDDLKDIFGLVD